MNLVEMLTESGKRYSDNRAIVFEGRKLSYRELNYEVEELAVRLAQLGTGKGDRIGILLGNSPEFIISYFAILKAGASVVPLNPMLKEELKYILDDSEARFLITSSKFAEVPEKIIGKLPKLKKTIILDEDRQKIEGHGNQVTEKSEKGFPEPSPEEVACIIYTSGTTGKPKGAMLTHNNLLSNVESIRKAFKSTSPEVMLCVLPLFHAFAATVCMLFPLSAGSATVIVDRFSPLRVLEEISENKVTMFVGVPPMYAVLANTAIPEKCELGSWRLAISGGAALPVKVMKAFEEKYKIPIYEGDGPTECSPVTSVNPIGGIRKPASIGMPVPGVQMKIVDEEERDLPPEELGEIVVKGPNVMKGYLNQPEATAEAIRDGWFHTGDMGKKDMDGYFYILDRKKDMIIVAGFNVYPREVEEVLYSHPKVLEATLIGVSDKGLRGEVPKAFIALKEGMKMTREEVISYCRKKLADYKVPKHVEFRESLPKTPTGKILKRDLRNL